MPRVIPGYTVLDPTVADLTQVVIIPIAAAGGGTDLQCIGYYKLRADNAAILDVEQVHESASFVMNTAQENAFATFLTTNLIPIIKAGEGL